MKLDLLRKASSRFPAPFRLRRLDDCYLLTNPGGDYIFLDEGELERFAEGDLQPDDELYERLRQGNFIARELDADRLVRQVSRRKGFLTQGPHLHIVIPTLRCNETCVYCHASRADMEDAATDMSPETAERAVDLALQSTSPDITIEFQGGEPHQHHSAAQVKGTR